MGITFLNKLYLVNAQSKPQRLLPLSTGNDEMSQREQETEHWSERRQNMKSVHLLVLCSDYHHLCHDVKRPLVSSLETTHKYPNSTQQTALRADVWEMLLQHTSCVCKNLSMRLDTQSRLIADS